MLTEIRVEWPEHYLAQELGEWNEYMNTSKTIKDALLELRSKEAFYVKKTEEVRSLIQGLESFGRNGDEQNKEVLVINGQEFIKLRNRRGGCYHDSPSQATDACFRNH